MSKAKKQADTSLLDKVNRQREKNLPELKAKSSQSDAAKVAKVAKPPKASKGLDNIQLIPLYKEKISPKPFPVEKLGGLLAEATSAIHEIIQAPVEICAQSVLATATLGTQAHADIELPTGQTRPISNFFITIAESGERKSSCDEEALKAVSRYEETLELDYVNKYKLWKNENDAWEKQRSHILSKNSNHKSYEDKKEALAKMPEQPLTPLQPILIFDEPTLEGLYKLLLKGQPSVGLFSDDGGQFLGGYSMKEDNKLKTAAALSHLWDGKPVKRIRAGDEIIILRGKRFSMHLMIQKGVSNKLLSDPVLNDQGVLSRLLVIDPPSAVGKRHCAPPSLEAKKTTEKYSAHMLGMLEKNLPLSPQNELKPRVLAMSKKAVEMWREFANDTEKLIEPYKELEPIKAFANKMPEHAARIASVLALTNDINISDLDENYLACGIEISQYYANEILRLSDMGTMDPDVLVAERLLDWLHNSWNEPLISLVNIYQLSLRAVRKKDAALKIVKILEYHGWLIKRSGEAKIRGKNYKEVWSIVK